VNEEQFKKFLGNERSEKTINLRIAAITGVEAFFKNKGHFDDFGQVKISEIQDARNAFTEFSFQSFIHLQKPSALSVHSIPHNPHHRCKAAIVTHNDQAIIIQPNASICNIN